MVFTIKSRDLDKDITKLQSWLQEAFGIKNCSKVDAIRYLLKMKEQGKKTDYKWEKVINED